MICIKIDTKTFENKKCIICDTYHAWYKRYNWNFKITRKYNK